MDTLLGYHIYTMDAGALWNAADATPIHMVLVLSA